MMISSESRNDPIQALVRGSDRIMSLTTLVLSK